MKNITRLLFALALALGLASFAEASIHTTTTLSTTVGTIVIPGIHTHTLTIQNTGATAVFISLDGGSTYTDPYANKPGTDPTTTSGYSLPAGQQIIISYTSPSSIRPIRAISATATATLQISTDDTQSTFPTT